MKKNIKWSASRTNFHYFLFFSLLIAGAFPLCLQPGSGVFIVYIHATNRSLYSIHDGEDRKKNLLNGIRIKCIMYVVSNVYLFICIIAIQEKAQNNLAFSMKDVS